MGQGKVEAKAEAEEASHKSVPPLGLPRALVGRIGTTALAIKPIVSSSMLVPLAPQLGARKAKARANPKGKEKENQQHQVRRHPEEGQEVKEQRRARIIRKDRAVTELIASLGTLTRQLLLRPRQIRGEKEMTMAAKADNNRNQPRTPEARVRRK